MKPLAQTILSITVIAFSVLASCKREEQTTWNVDMLGPIAHGRITLDDIIADSLLMADENNLWHIILNEDLTDFDLDSLVALPDTLIEKIFDVPLSGGPFTLPNNTTLIEEEENNLMKVNGAELKEVLVKSGTLRYKIKSYINGYLLCTYELPGASLNGIPIVLETTTQPSVGETPFIYEGEIDLAGYRIDMTGQSGFMFNRIYSHIVVKTASDAPAPAQVYGDDYVVVEMEFIEPRIEYARGYFGQHLYTIDETIDFGDDIHLPTGLLNLEGVSMGLQITNSVGADLSLQFTALESYNSYYDNNISLDHNDLFEAINIERAADNNGSINSHEYDFQLNSINSNIDSFVENLPDQLLLQAEVEVNPLGDVTDGNDFIYTNNAIKALLNLDIPLALGMQDLTMTDTLAIASTLELTANGTIKLYITNAFPFETSVSASIIDGNGTVLEPLIAPQLIASAEETSTAGVTIPAPSVITISASQVLLNSFTPEHRILLTVVFNTPDYPTVARLYKDYYMDFKVIADGEIEVAID